MKRLKDFIDRKRWVDRSFLMPRGALAALVLVAALSIPVLPATASPVGAADNLSGTWQVSRICVSGCVGTTTLTEMVRPLQGPVFMASGTATMLLYRIGKKKVLVHGATSSSLPTIRTPGTLMRGSGVGQDGSTFSVTWHCIAAAGADGSTREGQLAAPRLKAMPDARGIC